MISPNFRYNSWNETSLASQNASRFAVALALYGALMGRRGCIDAPRNAYEQ